jgi:NAD(P)-dependent dehydrogenase (short-subunit alcohol dehydrogenase family)
MPVELLDVDDVTSAVLYLAADSGRYVTGTTLTVDGGFANRK